KSNAPFARAKAGTRRALPIAGMKRIAMWVVLGAITALIAGILWAGPYFKSHPGVSITPERNLPIGTAGRETTAEPEDSPATIHDLETMTGALDPYQLIGERVDFH